MIAAVYGRKSTEQNGVGDEEKSVSRQIEHAKTYAAKKGWTVDDAHVYGFPPAAAERTLSSAAISGARDVRGIPPRP
jgi:hypothetical protein